MSVSSEAERRSCMTNVFITKYVPFQLQLNSFNRLAAVVCYMNIDVDARSADPYLPMKARGNTNDFNGIIAGLDPFVRSYQGTGKRHERFLGCPVVSNGKHFARIATYGRKLRVL